MLNKAQTMQTNNPLMRLLVQFHENLCEVSPRTKLLPCHPEPKWRKLVVGESGDAAGRRGDGGGSS